MKQKRAAKSFASSSQPRLFSVICQSPLNCRVRCDAIDFWISLFWSVCTRDWTDFVLLKVATRNLPLSLVLYLVSTSFYLITGWLIDWWFGWRRGKLIANWTESINHGNHPTMRAWNFAESSQRGNWTEGLNFQPDNAENFVFLDF